VLGDDMTFTRGDLVVTNSPRPGAVGRIIHTQWGRDGYRDVYSVRLLGQGGQRDPFVARFHAEDLEHFTDFTNEQGATA